MPRTGKGNQPIGNFPSPGYGQGEELAQMQREVPLPQERTEQFPMQPPPPQDPMALAQQFVNPVGVTPGSPTQRPTSPVTSGLPVGPGPGPEIMRRPRRRSRAADVLEMLAEMSGDSTLSERASRVRGEGF